MIELTFPDAAVLSRLTRFARLPEAERRKMLDELQSEEARHVGEIILNPELAVEFSEPIRATAERYRLWREANQRIYKARRTYVSH